jgi:DNA invertase Pin-like site-specific DNA recombinase
MRVRNPYTRRKPGRAKGPHVPILSLEQRKEIRAMIDAGAKYRECAEAYSVSIGTIQRVISYHYEQRDNELAKHETKPAAHAAESE